MANWNDPQPPQTGFGASPRLNGEAISQAGTYDQGLRKHMLAIYNYMASGVLLSGIVAMLFANSGMAAQVIGTPIWWVIALAPVGIALAFSFGLNSISTSFAAGVIQQAFTRINALYGTIGATATFQKR